MSALTFTKAALFGPSGSGKTYTALRIASGLGGRIAVIDTERGSASKYSDRFSFDVLDLAQKDIDTYVAAISAAATAGYGVLIIDSLSHAWQELLDQVDKLASTKFKGNSWSAWSEGTPKQRKLVDAILNYPGHVMATMRSKTEWAQEDDGRGKKKPVRVGLAPEQGKGIEYEFDLLLEISVDHVGHVLKDRSGKFQDKIVEKPGEDFGRELAAWLSDGATAPAPTAPATPPPAQTTLPVLDATAPATLAPQTEDTLRAAFKRAQDATSRDQAIAALTKVVGSTVAKASDVPVEKRPQCIEALDNLAGIGAPL